MINPSATALGAEPNEIRAIFTYGLSRKAAVGAENVFDLSLGNPSVPTPRCVDEAIARRATESDGLIHGYTESAGSRDAREAFAANLDRRFGTSYTADNIFITSGASSSLAIAFRALLNPGEEVIVFTPYFPEYLTWVAVTGAKCVPVASTEGTFQPDVEAAREAITEKTAMVIVNSPNNPTGVVYAEKSLRALAAMLEEKERELGHPIYLLSDEPYRELVYDGATTPWVPSLYADTVVAYSWSKSMSLPGERIAYVLVPDTMPGWRDVFTAIAGGARATGHICSSALFQSVVSECIDAPVDTASYDANRRLLMEGLDKLGYDYVEPQGAFYLWLKALEDDAAEFCEKAKKYELLMVPSRSFGVEGWVRCGYCCSRETIQGALVALGKLKADYDG